MPESIVQVSIRLAKREPQALIDGCLNRFRRFFALPGCITPGRPNGYSEPILADDYPRERLREIELLH